MSNKQEFIGKDAPFEASQAGDANSSAVPAEVQELIGRQLRRVYSGLVEARIPDDFTTLLDRLSAASAGANRNTEQET